MLPYHHIKRYREREKKQRESEKKQRKEREREGGNERKRERVKEREKKEWELEGMRERQWKKERESVVDGEKERERAGIHWERERGGGKAYEMCSLYAYNYIVLPIMHLKRTIKSLIFNIFKIQKVDWKSFLRLLSQEVWDSYLK